MNERARENVTKILAERIGGRVEVVFVKNAWTVLRQSKFSNGLRRVRVHEIFLNAPENVIFAIGEWVRKPSRESNRVIDQYVRSCHESIRALTPDQAIITKGKTRDLAAIFNDLAGRYFKKPPDCKITFGPAGGSRGRRARRAIQYGVYDTVKKLIRIHPLLDEPWIDPEFVKLIIYHEMLHCDMGMDVDDEGRRTHHSAAFRARERLFERYDAARAWENANFNKMLKAAAGIAKRKDQAVG